MIVQINERFQLTKFVSEGTIAAIQKSDAEGVKLQHDANTTANVSNVAFAVARRACCDCNSPFAAFNCAWNGFGSSTYMS